MFVFIRAAENISSVQSRTPVTDYKFIEAFKQRAILWDSRLDDYKNTERKNAVWIELSEEVGMTAGEYYNLIKFIIFQTS